MCQDCKHALEISQYNYCLCSKDPLRLPSAAGKCGRCRDKKLAGVYSALPYKEKFLTKKLIYQFKYEPHIKTLAKPLAEVIIEHLALANNMETKIWENSVFVPVPVEKSKQKARGYNQAEELTKELASIIPLPVVADNLVKTKKTATQTDLSALDRQKNIAGAFTIKNPAEFENQKVFLVDDVYTTGSTMEECAHVLRTQTRTKQVWGIVIARESLS